MELLPFDIIRAVAKKLDKWTLYSLMLSNKIFYHDLHSIDFIYDYFQLSIDKLIRCITTAEPVYIYYDNRCITIPCWREKSLWDLREAINCMYQYNRYLYTFKFFYKGNEYSYGIVQHTSTYRNIHVYILSEDLTHRDDWIKLTRIIDILFTKSVNHYHIYNLVVQITTFNCL